MEHDGLFVDDLLETLSRVRATPAAESPDVTSQALGEEGDQPDDVEVTTQAVGEEGDQAIESGWDSDTDDVPFDVPADSDDDDHDAYDTAL